MSDFAERIARKLEPGLWARWDARATRHAMSERILRPLVQESAGRVRSVIAEYETLKSAESAQPQKQEQAG